MEKKKEYVEVLEVLNYISSGDYFKIPHEKLEFFEENKDLQYTFSYDKKLSLAEQNVSREAMAILVQLYKDYIASPEEKDKIEEILRLNYIKNEHDKKGIYKDNIFQKPIKKQEIAKVEEVNWFKKFILKIKNILYSKSTNKKQKIKKY